MTKQLTIRMAGSVCAMVALVLYLNTLDCGIVFDDEAAIAWNKDLRPTSPWTNLLRHDFWGGSLTHPNSHKSYRPLCVATFRLNYLIHELEPMGYHLVNVLLHSAVCYLYVLLCGVIFGDVWPALIAGLLFTVHPIHTEAVAGLVGRAELLSAFFYLLAFFAYKKSLKNGTGTNYPWIAVSFLLSVCSLLSKEQGITIVVLCLVYDYFIIHKMDLHSSMRIFTAHESDPRKLPVWLRAFLKRAAALVVLTFSAVVVRIVITGGGPSQKVFHRYVNPPTALETPYRQLSWSYLSFTNSWLLLNPSQLCADWRFQAVPLITSLTDLHNLLTLATLTAVAILFLYGIRGSENQKKITLTGISFAVVPYIPASNLFFPVGFVVAERVLYLPSMGFCLLVGYGLWSMLLKANRGITKLLMKIAIGYLLFVHSLKTVVRNRDWVTGLTMYSSAVKFNPKSGVMLSNLGIEYAVMKNFSFAEELYRASTKVAPHYSRGFFNLGKLMKGLHRYSEAEWPLQKAIELGLVDTSDGKVAEAYSLLVGAIMQQEHRMEEALELCDTALLLYPLFAKLHANKASILLKLNRTQESVSAAQEAIKLDPSLENAHYVLGLAFIKTGDKLQAERAFQNVLLLQPDSTHAMLHLGIVFASSGEMHKLQEAERLLERVVELEPHNTEALSNLALVANDLHDDDKHKDALYRLAYSYHRSKKTSDTIETLQRLTDIDPEYLDSASLLHYFKNVGKK